MSTFAELVTATQLRLRDVAKTIATDVLIGAYINDGYTRVLGASPYWPFLELELHSTGQLVAAAANSITLPTDAFRVKSVFNSTDKIMMREMAGPRTHGELYPEQVDSPGTPVQYRVFNNTILVYPFAATATQLRVEYYAPPAVLSGSAVPVFPSQYHRLLTEWAMGLFYQDDDAPQQAAVHFAVVEAGLQDMKTNLLGPRGDSYPQINDDVFN